MIIAENEALHIVKIHAIRKYTVSEQTAMSGKSAEYSTDLKTFEFIYFVSGGSDTVFSGIKMQDAPCSLRYMPKGNHPGKYTVSHRKVGYCIGVYFDTDSHLPAVPECMHGLDILSVQFQKLYNVWSEKHTGYYEQAMSILYQIIFLIKKATVRYTALPQRSRLEDAHKYLMDHYLEKDFDYKRLCEQSGFCYSHFFDLFIRQYGFSPVKYVTMRKIEYAKELLATGRYSVGEIAERCGFENTYYFSTVFKKQVGTAPTKYMP